MGEKIKNLSSFQLGGKDVLIELNDGYDEKYAKYDIHIQSEFLQYCMTDKEYMKFASAIATARRRLEDLKAEK